jgi:hypothetical protein
MKICRLVEPTLPAHGVAGSCFGTRDELLVAGQSSITAFELQPGFPWGNALVQGSAGADKNISLTLT